MKMQVLINIIYLICIFVYQFTSKYKIDMVINVGNNEIRTVREQSKIYINDLIFDIKSIEDIPTRKSRLKSAFYFSCLGFYIAFTNLKLRSFTIIPIHRLTFLLTSIYFFAFAFRLFLTFFFPNLYQISSISLNIYLSGTILTLIIFGILTYKSIKQ